MIEVSIYEFTGGSMAPVFAPRIVFSTPLTDDEETGNALRLVVNTTVEESSRRQQHWCYGIVGPAVESGQTSRRCPHGPL